MFLCLVGFDLFCFAQESIGFDNHKVRGEQKDHETDLLQKMEARYRKATKLETGVASGIGWGILARERLQVKTSVYVLEGCSDLGVLLSKYIQCYSLSLRTRYETKNMYLIQGHERVVMFRFVNFLEVKFSLLVD